MIGWNNLIITMLRALKNINDEHSIDIIINNLEEKFGRLRVSLCVEFVDDFDVDERNSIWRNIQSIIQTIEKATEHVCIHCGEQGKLRNKNGWLETLCDECLKK